jgi:50S ribosomal protein L16 3-hydroxylase
MQLHNFDIETFLRDYWQQKPLLIKNPWSDWTNPLDPDELAGLACEDGVEARLVLQQRNQWNVEHGPIPEERFAKLPKTNWTLLVQAVDHFVPEVAELIEPFRFLPDWRIDDVMVSYAVDQGGVGAHYDQYDVFLIQGLGKRRWQIGAQCDHTTALQPNDQLRLLAEFDATEEWLLEPGDILYVPPRFAHNGIAVGDDCMTYSIGFRAPARSELIAHWCDYALTALNDDDRYADPGIAAVSNPGEISASAIDALQQMALEKLTDRAQFGEWFGRYSTTRKYTDDDIRPEQPISTEHLIEQMQRDDLVMRHPTSRFAFVRNGQHMQLFADGEVFDCTDAAALAEQLCAEPIVAIAADVLKSAPAVALLIALLNQGSLVFADDD